MKIFYSKLLLVSAFSGLVLNCYSADSPIAPHHDPFRFSVNTTNICRDKSSNSLDDYIYQVPNGWQAIRYPDGIVISPISLNSDEKCNISLWPMKPSSGNLSADAATSFGEVFKAFQLANGSTRASVIQGVSAQGWEYFIIKSPITIRGGQYAVLFGFVFVAKLGKEVAVISGVSKDPLVSSCFGLQLTDVWPGFFYSLSFKNWSTSTDPALLQKPLAGVWIAATATAGDRFAFAANGRYAGAAASQKYYSVNSTEMLTVTDAYFGNGSYTILGHQIILKSDGNPKNSESGLFRIESESYDGGRTWRNKLYLLRKSVVDGAEYELGYDKQ